ncbi:MAG: sigma 54-interacting transcriptional regulator [Planctomycetota bacterium]|nr:sigma 54-interacting transcriptional regulator [Planctomycetota bacterium]
MEKPRLESDGKVVELEGVVRIGRGQDNDIVVSEVRVSRYHCRLEKTENGWEIVDLGSRNGTFVNGRSIMRKVLLDGDEIRVGNQRFVFRSGTDAGVDTRYGNSPLDEIFKVDEERKSEKKRGKRDSEQERAVLEKLLFINRALGAELNLKKLLSVIMEKVLEVVRGERAFLILSDSGKLTTFVSLNLDGEPVKKADLKVSHSIAKTVLNSGKPILSVDAQDDERFKEFLSVHGLRLRSVLCVPLLVGQETIGVLYVDNRLERGVFDSSDLRILELFADQASIAVRNARLFEENLRKKEELEAAMRRVEELNENLKKLVEQKEHDLLEAQKLLSEQQVALKYEYPTIVTRSPTMLGVLHLIDRVTEADVPILLQGESGTGKELLARAIHEHSKRSRHRFVAVNCSAIPAELLESELFGYARGAFTGAERDKSGLLELADGGTLFLDEIGDMSANMQAKLLRVIEEKRLRRLGANEEIKVDFRIISATNKDLIRMVAEGKFRDDLLFRINVVTLTIPPLRERKEDIPLLVDHFLSDIARRNKTTKPHITPDAMDVLIRHTWDGNVRELRNEMERAAALSSGTIGVEHLSPTLLEKALRVTEDPQGTTKLSAKLLAQQNLPLSKIREKVLEMAEKTAIETVLASCGYNKSKTAKILGISRPTLDAKIKLYGITLEKNREEAS